MKKFKYFIAVFSLIVFCLPIFTFAAVNPAANLNAFISGKPTVGGIKSEAKITDRKPGYSATNTPTPAVLVGQVLGIVYSLLGVVALVLVVYAGFLWLFSQGNQEKIGKALGILKSSIIGLAILFSAYLITAFIITALGS